MNFFSHWFWSMTNCRVCVSFNFIVAAVWQIKQIFFFWNRYLQSIVVDLLIDYPWLLLISHTSFVWVLKNWNYRLCLFWLNLYKQIVSWLIFDHLFSYFRFYFFQIDKKNFNGTIKWKLVILWSKQQRSNVSRKCISCTFFSHL